MKILASVAVFAANLRLPFLPSHSQRRSPVSSSPSNKHALVPVIGTSTLISPAAIARPQRFRTDIYKIAKDSPIAQVLDNIVFLIGSTTTFVTALVFFGFLAWRRDAQMVAFVAGSIVNSILSMVLKRVINQARPTELIAQTSLKRRPKDKGMPSSHAMGLSFIAAFSSLCVPWTACPLSLYTFISLYYRVEVKLHTWQQVGVGFLFGFLNGYLWHRLCHTSALLGWVNDTVLNRAGRLPIPLLIVPVVAGVLVVGSMETRLKDLRWWGRS